MGKRKRTKNKPLTQEEIWDDSALIQSWDDAVEEYKVRLLPIHVISSLLPGSYLTKGAIVYVALSQHTSEG